MVGPGASVSLLQHVHEYYIPACPALVSAPCSGLGCSDELGQSASSLQGFSFSLVYDDSASNAITSCSVAVLRDDYVHMVVVESFSLDEWLCITSIYPWIGVHPNSCMTSFALMCVASSLSLNMSLNLDRMPGGGPA